jgi:hypothetical protein
MAAPESRFPALAGLGTGFMDRRHIAFIAIPLRPARKLPAREQAGDDQGDRTNQRNP